MEGIVGNTLKAAFSPSHLSYYIFYFLIETKRHTHRDNLHMTVKNIMKNSNNS